MNCSHFSYGQNIIKLNDSANYYYSQGKLEQAISFYSDIYQIEPQLSSNIYSLAVCNFELFNFNKAVFYFEILTKKTDIYPLAYYYLAQSYFFTRKIEQSVKTFRYFQNTYGAQYPNEYYTSKLFLEASGKQTDYNSIQLKIESDTLAAYSPLIIHDSVIVAAYRIADGRLIYSKSGICKKCDEIFDFINSLNKDICDLYINDKHSIIYFSICNYGNPIFCKIHYSRYINNNWTIPQPIETDSLYSSQITFINDTTIVFTSDRTGTIGKMDLWKATIIDNKYIINIENLGKSINTIGNDICPFYHEFSNELYFSSDGRYGFGGFDLYKTKLENEKPQNLGKKYNSPYNDLYFTTNQFNTIQAYVSNKEASVIGEDTLFLNKVYVIEPQSVAPSISEISFNIYYPKNSPLIVSSNLSYNDYVQLVEAADSIPEELKSESIKNLDTIIKLLETGSRKIELIEIEGFYSEEGTIENNKLLAKRRAEYIRTILKCKTAVNIKILDTYQIENKNKISIQSKRKAKIKIHFLP